MEEILNAVNRVLTDVVLPAIQATHLSQTQQVESNQQLERSLENLRRELELKFAELTAQLIACRAELASTQELLKAAGIKQGKALPGFSTLVH